MIDMGQFLSTADINYSRAFKQRQRDKNKTDCPETVRKLRQIVLDKDEGISKVVSDAIETLKLKSNYSAVTRKSDFVVISSILKELKTSDKDIALEILSTGSYSESRELSA